MESNKFATMLHRRSCRITFVLVYAFLEWALIFFLFLNALFSYLIIKFAHYFGLKPPCLLCSRIDHLFDPQSSESSYRNLICEQHGIELSKSGYCFNHRKLVESQDMCEDCSSSHPDVWSPVSVSQWLKEVRTVKSDEVNLRCSCCGVSINSKTLSSHAVIKPCLGVSEDAQKGNLISSDGHVDDVDSDGEPGGTRMGLLDIKSGEDDGIQISKDVQMANSKDNLDGFSFCLPKGVRSMVEAHLDEDVVLEAKRRPLPKGSSISMRDPYANEKILLQQHLDFYIDCDDLIPVELINLGVEKRVCQEKALELWRETDDELVFEPDMAVAPAGLSAEENLNSSLLDLLISDEHTVEDMPNKHGQEEEMIEVERNMRLDEFTYEDLPTKQEQEEELKEELDGIDNLEETTVQDLVTERNQAEETKKNVDLESAVDQAPAAPPSAGDVQETEDMEVTHLLDVKIPCSDAEFVCHEKRDQLHAVCCGELMDSIQLLEPSSSCKEEGPTASIVCEASASSSGLQGNGDDESKQTNEERESLRDVSVEISGHESKSCVTMSHELDENHEIEEDRVSDTPTSVDSLQYLQRKVLPLGTRGLANDESLDGSIINELRDDGGNFNIEDLNSEFRALYAELEEERNASATAAHHTMAMINRLHEEKAAIEMEALQYQRIMEEQADYDQESLQLMNEVLVKMESEKQELEMELEACRKKIMEYEERERARLMNQKDERSCAKSRTSSASCSNGEESDELSFNMNNGSAEQYSLCRCEANGHHDTRADVILSLKESLSCFEEERISILQQLKVLEEKLCNLVEEEEQSNGSVKPFEQFNQYNGEELCTSFKLYGDANGLGNGSPDENGEHHQDSAALEIDNRLFNGIADRLDPFLLDELPLTRFNLEKRRFTIEEEVEHVYERLQALEADRAFVKHCIGSLSKGDRGIDLLQEILQHLRDLKNIEIRARNLDGMC